MSFRHARLVWGLEITPSQMHILHALASLANDQDECWPGYDYLAQMTRYSQSTIQRNIRQLVDLGFVEIVETNKRHQPTRYRVILGENGTDAMDGQDDHPIEPMGDQDDYPTKINGWSNCSDGWSNYSSDVIKARTKDPVLDPVETNPPFHPPQGGGIDEIQAREQGVGAHQFPPEFVHYFQSIYPVQDGMWKAFQVFQRHRLTQPQLEYMREVILWRRGNDPKWRGDTQGKRFILNPVRFMRERQYGDPIPGKPPPCPHSPERVALDARDEWACIDCGHVLSPTEAERRGLTAEADDGSREALAAIRSMLGRRA